MKENMKTINEIIKIIGESQLTEANIEEDGFKLFIKKPKLILKSKEKKILVEEKKVNTKQITDTSKVIVSENVGRFFYVDENERSMLEEGMKLKKGQKIGYVEAMGIRTNITSKFDGVIKEILVRNGGVAEYGKGLVRVVK